MFEPFQVDLRVGCVAIVDLRVRVIDNRLCPNSGQVVKFWFGARVKGGIYGQRFKTWHVPMYKVKRAKRLAREMNLQFKRKALKAKWKNN